MKNKILYFAFLALLVSMANHWIYFVAILILATIWAYKYKKVKISYLLVFLWISYLFFHIPYTTTVDTFVGEVLEVRDSYVIVQFNYQKALVYTEEELVHHTQIEVEGEFEPIESLSNFSSFDFSQWCQRRNISQSIKPTSIKIVNEAPKLRSYFYNRVKQLNDEEVKSWCMKFLFGLNQEEDDFFMIFSSGVHLSLIVSMIRSCFDKKRQTHVNVFFTVFLFIYQYLIRTTFAMQRLIIVSIVHVCFSKESRKDQLGIIILVCLFAFPYCIYELAFLIPTFFSLLTMFSTRPVSKTMKQICVLLPLQLYMFSTCNLLSLLSFHYLRYLYALGFLMAHLVVIFPVFSILMRGYLLLIPILNSLNQWTLSLLGKPSLLWMLAFYYVFFHFISRNYQRDSKQLLFLVFLLLFKPYLDPRTHVYFINVGQGDSCLIILPFNQGSMLIDVAGSLYRNIPKQNIQPYLDAHGLRALDMVVLTHQDYDHAGGLKELMTLIPVKEVIQNKKTPVFLKKLSFVTLLSDIEFKDENENSLVLVTNIGSLTYFFTGDASLQFENAFLEKYPSLPVDILKVGHHGSKSSSSQPFIQALSPRISVISVAKNNTYGHPSHLVLETLDTYHSKVFQTAIHGAIHIQSLFNFNLITTSRKEFGIIVAGDKNELFNLR